LQSKLTVILVYHEILILVFSAKPVPDRNAHLLKDNFEFFGAGVDIHFDLKFTLKTLVVL
jgi:hypothetical protein